MRGGKHVMLVAGIVIGALTLGPVLAHHDPGHTKKQIKRVHKRLKTTSKALNAGAADAVTAFGPVAVSPGAEVALITGPPFTVKAECRQNGAHLETYAFIETTEEGSLHSGDDTSSNETVFGPTTPKADRTFEDPGADTDPATTSIDPHSDGYDDQFSAFAPSGAAIQGWVSSVASLATNSCRFYGHWATVIG